MKSVAVDTERGSEVMSQTPWRDADSLKTYCNQVVSTVEKARDQLKSPDRTANDITLLHTYNDIQKTLDTASGWAAVSFSMHPDKTVRTAAQTCRQNLSELANALNQDRDVYDAVASVDVSQADPLTQRFSKHALRSFKRSGVDKDPATRKKLAKIHAEITRLSQEYKKRLLEDVKRIEIDDVAQLDGLPKDWIEAHPKNKNGKIEVTTDYPDFIPFQTYCKDGSLRKKLYEVFMTRGHPKNGDTLKEILALRHEYANLLGHKSWASYNAEDKMVKTSDTIDKFIQELVTIVRPKSDADLKLLLERKQKDDPKATTIEAWDRYYYLSKVREEKYGFDARKIRPYFPYKQVTQGILDLYGELFGLRFEALPNEPVWHPDVQAMAMYHGDVRVGIIYMDMHPREGKYKHAAMFGIQTGLKDGRIPRGALVCNFPDPSKGDGKALMEHTQVTTYFHEFGHLIHHLMARNTNWVTLAGINVEWDFVEAPSQILEEWAWSPKVLQRFAKHVDTGKPIPPELVQQLRASEEFGKGAHIMRQLFYTAYSYYLHAQDPKSIDLEKFTDGIHEKFSPYPRIPNTFVYSNFGHLIGYSSMYYTYQWSLVIAKDLFTRFEKNGLLNTTVARDYVAKILVPGGTADATELVRSFLGRDYNLDAYKAWLQE